MWKPLACSLCLLQPIAAEIILAPPFQNGGVLQRERPIPVWGTATANAPVQVTFGGETKSTAADGFGHWQVTLSAIPASAEGRTMTVKEANLPAVEVKDLLVGEVWLGSGQSNMQWDVASTRQEDQALAAAGPIPLMRVFDVPRVVTSSRKETLNAKWTPATPETARPFSAVAYFFGKRLAEELKVPVGIIHSSWGGSRIEPWWAEEGLEGIPELNELRQRRLSMSPGFPGYDAKFKGYVTAVRTWADLADKSLAAGMAAPDMPAPPEMLKLGSGAETGTYQAMIHPLAPYALRGFLWYQGESNNGEGMLYMAKMQALIAGWRKVFKNPDAPFLFVQLAPNNYGPNRTYELPGIWAAQQAVLKIPHTGMAVTNDIATINNIHPPNKSEVARRLALWAFADTYGQKDLVKSGPLFSQYKVVGATIAVRFDQTGGGLVTRDGKAPTWFEIAGMDGEYRVADAKISGDGKTITLSNADVPQPDRARFAWSQIAEPNLMNREGLPAAAFNTHWPVDPTLGHLVSGNKPIVSSHPNMHGWDTGLTDGVWGNAGPTCYATAESPEFPKTVTIDLGAVQPIQMIRYATPDVGATKTVAVSISEDGKQFTEVGRNVFPPKKATTAQARFNAQPARFVRATFIDHHPTQDGYSVNHGFLSEVEVYAP